MIRLATFLIFSIALAVDAAPAFDSMRIPRLVGDPWQICGNPNLGSLTGANQQPVDFGVWQADDTSWQLWACIRNTNCGGNTRLFYGWEAAELTDTMWNPIGITMQADVGLGETPGGLQAPHVIREEDHYEMVYGDWVNICRATSTDGKVFDRVIQTSGDTGMFSESDRTWDPMLLKVDDLYYCYYTALPAAYGLPSDEGAVYCRMSSDLETWSASTVVCRGGQAGTGSFSSQCPFVGHDSESDLFYLFRTNRTGSDPETTVYCSPDPLNFGNNDDQYRIGTLPIAAPELVEQDGEFYVGWIRTTYDGLQISRLEWTEPATPQSAGRYASYEAAVKASEPLAYWRFEDASSADGQTAEDETEGSSGVYRQSISFDEGAPTGASAQSIVCGDGWVDVGSLPGFGAALDTGVTVEMWIKSDQTGEGITFGLGGATDNQFFINLDENPNGTAQDDRIRVYSRGNGATCFGGAAGDTNITDGGWHYLAVVFRGSESRIEIYMADPGDDATRLADASILSGAISGSSDFDLAAIIGGINHSDAGPRQFFTGLIDELAVFDRPLSKAELDSRLASIDVLAGDLDGDGLVGSGDLDLVRGAWGSTVTPGDLAAGDADGDGNIGSSDLDLIRAAWGVRKPVAAPEPAWTALLGGVLAIMFCRSRRAGSAVLVLAILAVSPALADEPPLVPRIAGDWIQVAYSPAMPEIDSEPGGVCDHCFFKAKDGKWRLWTQIRGCSKGRLFYAWQGGEQFARPDWKPLGICWRAGKKHGESIGTGEGNDIIQAPFVFEEDGKYTVFYGGGPHKDGGDYQICRAVSEDGVSFKRCLNENGLSRVFVGPGQSRDAMILKIDGWYFCYYCADEKKKGIIALRTTRDLESGEWSEYTIASEGGILGTHSCSQQCPYVVFRNGYYYLFKIPYSSEYRCAVYASKDPTFFGKEDEKLITVLPASAPEIVRDGGEDYISSMIPGDKGIRIARLEWVKVDEPYKSARRRIRPRK